MQHDPRANAHADLEALNLRLLSLVRDIARRSPAEAALRFGLEIEAAQAVGEASLDALLLLAGTGKLVFRPIFTAADIAAVVKQANDLGAPGKGESTW